MVEPSYVRFKITEEKWWPFQFSFKVIVFFLLYDVTLGFVLSFFF